MHWVYDAINHLILCRPLLLPASIFLAWGSFQMYQLFASGKQSIGASVSGISPSNEYSRLISFRMDWFDLLAVQGTLKSLLQLHNSKASILWCSTFFMVQLSYPYITTGKTIPLTTWTFVGKVMDYVVWKLLSAASFNQYSFCVFKQEQQNFEAKLHGR